MPIKRISAAFIQIEKPSVLEGFFYQNGMVVKYKAEREVRRAP